MPIIANGGLQRHRSRAIRDDFSYNACLIRCRNCWKSMFHIRGKLLRCFQFAVKQRRRCNYWFFYIGVSSQCVSIVICGLIASAPWSTIQPTFLIGSFTLYISMHVLHENIYLVPISIGYGLYDIWWKSQHFQNRPQLHTIYCCFSY